MWPFSSKKRRRVAVFLHDGANWHAHIFTFGKPRWRSVARTVVVGPNPRSLPEALFDFADKHGARRARLVLPQNIYMLNTQLPRDAEAEELQTAMAFELGTETGADIESLRVAAAQAETFRMGATADMLIAAVFEEDVLEQYEKACQAAGFDFDGAGTLELATLGAHAERCPEARLLLLRRDTAFYAVPATDLTPMTAGAVAFGVDENHQREQDEERRERIVRRFNLHMALPMSICCIPMPEQHRMEQLRELAGGGAEVEFRDFDADVEDVLRQVAQTAEVGFPAGGGAVVSRRPPEVDPYRAGTWIFFLVLLMAVIFVGLFWYKLHSDLTAIEVKSDAWNEIKSKRDALEQKYDSLRSQRSKSEKTVDLLTQRTTLPAGLLPLIDALDKAVPEFTRITSIEGDGKGGFLVYGHTAVQSGLINLERGLLAELGELGHPVEQRELRRMEDSLEYGFVFWIGPKKGN